MAVKDILPWRAQGLDLWKDMEDTFSSLQRQFNRMWTDYPGVAGDGNGRLGRFIPTVDVDETDKHIVVTAEIPGMEEKDISLTVNDHALVLQGEKREEKKDAEHHLLERSYGHFRRVIPMPDGVDVDKVAARFKNGILTVEIPKNAKAIEKTRKVEVKAG